MQQKKVEENVEKRIQATLVSSVCEWIFKDIAVISEKKQNKTKSVLQALIANELY